MLSRLSAGLRLAVLLVLAAPSLPAGASEADRSPALCEQAALGGARRGGVPASVLHAVALTETGHKRDGRLRPWPWAVNREGRGHWFATRNEALAFARASLAEGRTSFDVGCFQINYRWHGRAFASLEAMFDPDAGADYAARFLSELYRGRGDWSEAAGAYHSRTPHYAQVYRARFDRILAGLDKPSLEALEVEPPTRDAAPRKSRTRMARRPLIITIDPAPPPASEIQADAGKAMLRVQRGGQASAAGSF